MPTPPTYPPAAQLSVLTERLAKIAKVPTNYQHDFCERIIQTVLGVRNRDRRTTGQIVGGLLSEAADAARRLRDTYSRMSQEDRDWVDHIKRTQMQFTAGEIQHVEATISNLSMLLHSATGRASPVPKPPRRAAQKGRHDLHKELGMLEPRVKNQILRELVFGLLHAARDAGGELDFNKNRDSGALAVTLRLLRDGKYLPPDLVPDPLRGSTIQRLKDEFSRLTS
jgi:hypothetical protein